MSRWRPSEKNCLYVIPDVHGSLEMLKKICGRILPLRKSDGGKDRIVFLGDYIDRHIDSHLVIDYLIELQAKYGDQVIFLMGNHEYMLLQSIDMVPGKSMTLQNKYHANQMWMSNGGNLTMAGYLHRKSGDEGWGSVPISRIPDFIPKDHITFFQGLRKYYEVDDFIFVHGGLDPDKSPYNQPLEEIVWDRSLVKNVINSIRYQIPLPNWDKTIVCGHTVQSDGVPIITQKFMMLDCGSPAQLLVVEMHTLEAYMAYPGKTRMLKYELKETTSFPGVIRRSSD